MKLKDKDVKDEIEKALGDLSFNSINIQEALVKNANTDSLYQYLKHTLEELFKIDDLEKVPYAIYFENDLFKGMFFCGKFIIRFDAKNFSSLFDSNVISIAKNIYGEEKIKIPASSNDDVLVKRIGSTYDENDDDKDKFMSYSYSNGEIYQELSFNIKRPYVDYFVNQKKTRDLSISLLSKSESNNFVNNHYYCTSEFGGITKAADGILERIKELQKIDKSKFHYNGDEKKLKMEMIYFSTPLIEVFNNIERKITEAIKKYPIRIVDYDEIKFKDDEEKEKTK